MTLETSGAKPGITVEPSRECVERGIITRLSKWIAEWYRPVRYTICVLVGHGFKNVAPVKCGQ